MTDATMKPGTLWPAVLDSTQHAVECGALERIPTRIELVEEAGIRFQVHLVQQLERKRAAKLTQREEGTNPFLPYDIDMFVYDLSKTHVCLLNKFNVMEHHLLLVTREFEHQESRLTVRDFEAMRMCLGEFEGLAFYNSGAISGASQPHKHLQQVPLPLGGCGECTPIDGLVSSARFDGTFATIPVFDFRHSLVRVPQLGDGQCTSDALTELARETEQLYSEMLSRLGLGETLSPYNLLATREWMMLIPRSREHYDSISVNAMGFAGSLLARNQRELDLIREAGVLRILKHVTT